jgi:hypothetical protein
MRFYETAWAVVLGLFMFEGIKHIIILIGRLLGTV